MRPCSPESVVSFDEYRPLSPDSPVPHFMPKCCNYYLAPTGDRSSSPQSVTSDIEFSEFCLEELFAEDRADSPESLISEDGMRLVDESDKDKSQDRPMTPDSTSGESLSFLEDWFSELDLRPSSPESIVSQEEYRHLSPDSPVLQYGPGLSVFAVSSGEKCWTPESVISDLDEFGLEDLLCATRACSPDSVCSNTDTVLTDGQHSPPIDQVSTEHEPEMRVERARLKQPPEIIGAPFSLVFPVVCQTHRAVEAFFCRASSPDSHREPVEDVDLDWLDDVETHRPHQASSQSSHVLSDEQNLGSPVAAVRAEEAVHERLQASCKSIQRKEHSNVPTLKGSEVQPKIDETSKRKPMRKAEDSRVSAPSVSAVSSMENLSEPKHVLALDQPSTNRPISNKTLMSETQSVTPDLQIPNAFEFSPLSPEMTMPTEKMRVSPESPEKPLNLNKESSSSETSPVLPDLLSHNSEDSQGDEPQWSATNLQTPLESGAPAELDQLLSEFEEIKPNSDQKLWNHWTHLFRNPAKWVLKIYNLMLSLKISCLNQTEIPLRSPQSRSEVTPQTPETVTAYRSHLRDSTPPETLEYDEQSPQSLSDVTPQTPETVTVSRHFSFEELIPYQSPRYLNMLSEELKPNTSEKPSENPVTPGPVEPRAEMVSAQPVPEVTASAHDEEFFMEFSLPPEYAEASSSIHKPKPPAYAEVIRGSTTMHLYEDSDPETYFDCKQGVSDFFETEPDELKKRERKRAKSWPNLPAHTETTQPFTRLLRSFVPLRAADDDDSLDREVAVEVGEMTSDEEEFLTSRVVRRRVIIQQDEMTDIPPQTVTEEHYTDQHGHTVVRKVTRKVNRQVMSSEGSQREEVRVEGGAPPGEEGDGYSRVVERTVLRSHRDHSEVRVELGAPPEVTFSERDSDSVWGEEESAEGREVSRVERNAVVVEGDWTETHHGDPTLTSDLPTARDDFTQGQDV
ncbi:uncharacterized protein [Salmo salar]|uniref:Uncharacterized protein n=1 Tax=Salmo salar TaxID=8030 RepID=A0ABM3EDB6_SALSA|nr:uncharacterized protein LOC106591029 [Salmo salar]